MSKWRKQQSSRRVNDSDAFGFHAPGNRNRDEKKSNGDWFDSGFEHSFFTEQSQQWATDMWGNDQREDNPWRTNKSETAAVDTSFETLEFSASSTVRGGQSFIPISSSPTNTFDDTAFSSSDHYQFADTNYFRRPKVEQKKEQIVSLIQTERLSILFDGVDPEPQCRIVGSIHANQSRKKVEDFCFRVQDKKGSVERWEEQSEVCQNISDDLSHMKHDYNDQIFRVSLEKQINAETPIVAYSCVPRLKSIPMLLKTKVQKIYDRCRVGIIVRANPKNGFVLAKLAVILVVPPSANGDTVTMSRVGGIWDEMKRTVSWPIESLEPGEVIDIQVQFEHATTSTTASTLKFPVLVRADAGPSFSRIELDSDVSDGGCEKVQLQVEKSTTVLYRKV